MCESSSAGASLAMAALAAAAAVTISRRVLSTSAAALSTRVESLATAALAAAAAVTISRRVLSTSAAALSTRVESLPRRRPANVGDALGSVETPCLVIDLEAMERNLVELPRSLRAFPQVAIRPHAKAHKSAGIGRQQLHLSRAVGLCCQKVAEAEAMFAGGITDLLLSNEIVGADRYARMAALATQGATVTLLFDHADTAAQAQQVARDAGVVFHALVDVNVGQNRCGVDSVDDALALAWQIDEASHLVLKGIQAYHGGAQHIRDYADKTNVILEQVATKAQRVRDAFEEHGLCCDVVTGGGTGTYLLEACSGVFTEVQPGSYLFNDADYARNRNAQGDFVNDWVQSLFVLTTVMSVNTTAPQQRAVVDAGTKAVSLDSGVPLVYSSIDLRTLPPLVYQGGGDEHGILVRDPAATDRGIEIPMPSLGQKLLLTPGHCDPTVNLYDFVVGFRNGVVESVWHIGARGPGN